MCDTSGHGRKIFLAVVLALRLTPFDMGNLAKERPDMFF